jgi:hypothetical protein
MRGNAFRVGPWNGGLNLRDKFMEMGPGQIPVGQNMYAGEDGVIKKRNPSVVSNSTFSGSAGTNAAYAIKQIPFLSDNAFIVTVDDKVYQIDISGGNISTNITGIFTFQFFSDWSVVEAATSGGQGPMYAISGSIADPTVQWTGAGNLAAWTASAGTLSAGSQMVSFKNRIFMIGSNIGSGTGVRACKVGDPRNWDTTGTASDSAWETQINPNEGGDITAIWPFGAYLLVFKKDSISLIYDLDTGANRLITKQIGAQHHRNFCDTPYGVAFGGSDGHVWLTDATKQSRISDILTIREGGNAVLSSGNFGLPYTGSVSIQSMAYHDDKLIVCGTGTWWYDFPTKTWWGMGQDTYNDMAVKTTGFGTSYATRLLGTWNPVSSPTPRVHYMYVPSFTAGSWKDNVAINGTGGTAYTAFFETPPIAPVGRRGQEQNLRRRYHAMRGYVSGTCNVKYVLDSLNAVPTYTTLGSVAAGTGLDTPVETTWYSLGVGNSIRFRFDSTDSNAFAVHPFNVYTQPRTD